MEALLRVFSQMLLAEPVVGWKRVFSLSPGSNYFILMNRATIKWKPKKERIELQCSYYPASYTSEAFMKAQYEANYTQNHTCACTWEETTYATYIQLQCHDIKRRKWHHTHNAVFSLLHHSLLNSYLLNKDKQKHKKTEQDACCPTGILCYWAINSLINLLHPSFAQ